jgi:Fe-S-cluster containining protein
MTVEDPAAFFSIFPGLKELIELYKDLDEEASRFKKAAALDCLEFCTKCCTPDKAQIEASVFECLPLSIHLWKLGEADSYLQRIALGGERNLCVLYNADHSPLPASGCKHYSGRPLLCRLFGFSAVLEKHGHPRIALCRTIKDADPHAADRINQEIARGLKPMIIPHWARQASSLNPRLGQERYPINQAVRFALERVGLHLHLLQNRGEKGRGVGQEDFKENPVENRSH